MRQFKKGIISLLVAFTLIVSGCNLFPQQRTRPAPARPTPTSSPFAKDSSPRNFSHAKSLSEKDLMDQINSVEKAVKENNWNKANRDGDVLGLDMTRYRPDAPDGKSLRDLSRFDVIFTKLQANLKTKNKAGCIRDLNNLREELKGLKKK
jgi:hypothetical protein